MQNDPLGPAGEPMSAVTRRSFLRATAGLIGAASVALTIGASGAAAHPEAELLALGEAFDAAYRDYRRASRTAAWLSSTFHAGEQKADAAGQSQAVYWSAWGRSIGPATDAADSLAAKVDGLTKRIRAVQAKTFVGVAVKARTLRYDLGEPGDHSEPLEEWEWEEFCLESFIREMQAIGGGLA